MPDARRSSVLLALLIVAAVPTSPVASFIIQPGIGIGPIIFGMADADLERALGTQASIGVAGGQTVLTYARHGLTVWLERGRVARVRTTNSRHKTTSGFGPGQANWQAARAALCVGLSAAYDVPGGLEIRCPFAGLIIEVAADRIAAIAVTPPESPRGAARPRTQPSPGQTPRPGVPSPPLGGPQGLPPLPNAPGVNSSEDAGVINLVNIARAQSRMCAGRAFEPAPLVDYNDRLAYAARMQALDMAIHDYVEHSGWDGSTPAQRVDRVGYRYSAVGENVAGGRDLTASEVVKGWLETPSHCSLIMTRDFSEAGAAWARSPRAYRMYWALVLARPR